MTLPIVPSRPATDRFAPLGTVADALARPRGASGDGDPAARPKFRTALDSAIRERSGEAPRDVASPIRRPRGGRPASHASPLSLVRAEGAAGEGEVRDASTEKTYDTGILLAADSRTTFIGSTLSRSPSLDTNDWQHPPILVPLSPTDQPVADGGRSSEDGATAAAGFVASSLEVATAALTAVTGSDPMSVRRDLAALSPELRNRLERIVDRMQSEFGYTVEVVETVRTQDRQEALFAQGRTTPGPIVTWTRASNHIEGRAADVIIDGSYGNPQAYERLARVASEEGVRTLWPRDPGHVELPTSPATAGEYSIAALARRAAAEGVRALPMPQEGDGVRALPMPQAGDGVHALPMPRERDGVRALPVPGDNDGVRAFPMLQNNDGVHALPIPRDNDGVRALPMPQDSDGVYALPMPRDNDGVRALPVPGANGGVRALPMPSVNDGVRALPMPGEDHGVRALPMPRENDGVRALPMPQENDGVHVLPFPARGDGVARQGFGDTSVPVGQFARVAQVATLAQVATVATVATVASVAQAARVGETGQSAPSAPVDVSARPESTIAGAPMRERDAGSAPQNGERQSSGERRDRDKGEALLSALADREAVGGARAMLSREVPSLDVRDGLSTAPVAGLSRSDATERIARVLRMQESAGDRPLSSVLLRLDHPEGGEDRIRIDLRGHSVGATLDMSDPRVAEQLRAHAPELQQALQRQGLEGEAMVVRSASRSTDSAAYSLSAGGAERDLTRAASATASDGGGSTAKDSRNQPRAQHEREGTDQQRSRQRRDGKGEQK